MKARTLILTAGAALALAVPAAHAMPLYPEGDGPAATRYSAQPLQAVRPDDRAGALGVGETPGAVVASSPSGGFDWRDLGLGAGSAGALLLLGASLTATSRRRSAAFG